MWTKGLNWDEPIDRELSIRARDWLSELENLQEFNVPRCLQEFKLEKSISVQTFVDASNEAYGAVSYSSRSEEGRRPSERSEVYKFVAWGSREDC